MFFSLYPHEIIAHSTLDVDLSLTPGGLQISTHAAHKIPYSNINVGFRPAEVDKKISVRLIYFEETLNSLIFASFCPLR